MNWHLDTQNDSRRKIYRGAVPVNFLRVSLWVRYPSKTLHWRTRPVGFEASIPPLSTLTCGRYTKNIVSPFGALPASKNTGAIPLTNPPCYRFSIHLGEQPSPKNTAPHEPFSAARFVLSGDHSLREAAPFRKQPQEQEGYSLRIAYTIDRSGFHVYYGLLTRSAQGEFRRIKTLPLLVAPHCRYTS